LKRGHRNAAAQATAGSGKTVPKTAAAEITRSAIRMTADRSQIHKKCDRRDCRLEQGCLAEEYLEEKIAYCGDHWSDSDRDRFWGAAGFGLYHLCPRRPDDADPEEYRWKEGVEDSPHDLVPKVIFVHRKAKVHIHKMP
jgi:hypothetical protein